MNSTFQLNRKKNDQGRHLTSSNRAAIFVSISSEERHNKPCLLATNLVSQQNTTKPHFSSQVRKQFKLLALPFKPLRCRLQNDKLTTLHTSS